MKDLLDQIRQAYKQHHHIVIKLSQQTSQANTPCKRRRKTTTTTTTYLSISHNPIELQRFAAILKLIQILTRFLSNSNSQSRRTTVRDIYYQDVEIFNKSQTECKRLLDSIVENSLGWSLVKDLNIYPSQKGLFYEYNYYNPKLKLENNHPILIPMEFEKYQFCGDGSGADDGAEDGGDYGGDDDEKKSANNTSGQEKKQYNEEKQLCVAIFEKDAVFESFCKHLANGKFKFSTRLIIVTAKGYADSLTLAFLKWIQSKHTKCTFIGFFDADVYGVNIYQQYKKVIESLKYAGIFLLNSKPQSWLNTTLRDIKVAATLADKAIQLDASCHRELTRQMFLLKKGEINVISGDDGNYNTYLISKIKTLAANT